MSSLFCGEQIVYKYYTILNKKKKVINSTKYNGFFRVKYTILYSALLIQTKFPHHLPMEILRPLLFMHIIVIIIFQMKMR